MSCDFEQIGGGNSPGRAMTAQVLEARKDAVILGTLESAAFILSLRSGDEFSEVHSSGYHRVPHIGEWAPTILL